MPKSTPRPTNSTAKAIEIRLSGPTTRKPSAAVIGEPDEQIDEHRQDDPAGLAARARGSTSTISDGGDAVDQHAFLHGGEFLVRDRHRSGEPHSRAIVGRELEIGGGLADRIGRGFARLERGEIELRAGYR